MKRFLSIFLSLVMVIISVVYTGIIALAGEYISKIEAFSYKGYDIPAYDGDLYEVINNNEPKFLESELNQRIYESYGALDSLGRVTACTANIDQSLMPTEARGSISSVYPTGWVQKSYDFVNGKYLYNRSHLIGFQLTGENANKNNLMTGTRTFNVSGMLPFENQVAAYVKANKENNVLYRVTPVFEGDNLLADGVIMEGESVDDNGASVEFCVFVYNVENGVSIDYSTGDSIITDSTGALNISSASVNVSSCTYNGKAQCPRVTVEFNGTTLMYGKDYEASYSNNINAGTAKVKITGINSYCGEVTKSFTIAKAKYTPSVSSKAFTYDGKAHSIAISGVKAGSAIKYKTSSSGTYSTKKPTRTSVGKTTIYYSITNPNYYAISGSKTVTINPKSTSISTLTATSKGFKTSWKKQATQTTGYQIQYSTSSSFKSPKTITVSKNTTTSKSVTKLKAKTKYYVRVRTYKTVSGTKYYSSWSSKKYVTTKK